MQSTLLSAILITRNVSITPLYISKQIEERSLLGEPMDQDSNQSKGVAHERNLNAWLINKDIREI
jgi:hypothetical protein